LIYTFEGFSLDADRRELCRGSDLITVEPQVFDLLEYLIKNRERIVSKDDLIADVWEGRIVSESTLSSRISAVRQAVGDSGDQQRLIRTVLRKGFRFVGAVHEKPTLRDGDSAKQGETLEAVAKTRSPAVVAPAVTFCKTRDGINIAIASAGVGPVLVRPAHWVLNLEYDWQSPLTGPLLRRLADRYRLIRYDARGTGLSDRNVSNISFATLLDDLETVVDSCQLERFALLGISSGAAVSIAYAARHPHRISKLVIYGGYALGRMMRGTPQDVDEAVAMREMLRRGWYDPAFMRAHSSVFMPDASTEQVKWLSNLMWAATSSGEVAAKVRNAYDEIAIVDLLPKVKTPTIVLHCRHDSFVPFEQGRLIAASIPNAKFVALESRNHALLPDEPAWAKFVGDMEDFLASGWS